MKSPKDRYERDAAYKQLVDALCALIKDANFTPSEVREAAMMACIHYEMWHGFKHYTVPLPVKIALETLATWRKSETNPATPESTPRPPAAPDPDDQRGGSREKGSQDA